MKAKFTVWDWKEIMRCCGPCVSDNESYYSLHFIRLDFGQNWCQTYGADSYHVVKREVPCAATLLPTMPYTLFIRPMKTPAGTRSVILQEPDKDTLEVVFMGKDDAIIETVKQLREKVEDINVETFFQKTINNLRDEKYTIAVDPRYLMNALNAMKDRDSVILHFGTCVQPFMIMPYDDGDQLTQAIVLPMRMLR